jgi:3-oxoacyl-[acyl-carrier-protein] synthase II
MVPLPRNLDVCITGIGVVTPVGIGREAYFRGMLGGSSGIRQITRFDARHLPAPFGGEIRDFDAKQYVRPRKSLKVMNREIQMAFAAADLAWQDAGLGQGSVDPDRLGVVFGADMMYCELEDVAAAFGACMSQGRFDFTLWGERAFAELHPLWLLKYLPNMAACHIGIALDARGPCNTITLGDVSGLLAVVEAALVIARGGADMMVVGGTDNRLHPTRLVSWGDNGLLSRRRDEPARACRPFDARRDGMVNSEGAGALVLESRRHAEMRHAGILARLIGYGSRYASDGAFWGGVSVRRSICDALQRARLERWQLGYVSAQGLSTVAGDRMEARAIHETLGAVPVTAPKGALGNLGAAAGAVELALSTLALSHGQVPATLNYEYPDPACPLNIIRGKAASGLNPIAMVVQYATTGQAVSVVIDGGTGSA